MALPDLATLADEWEDNKALRDLARKTGSLFKSDDDAEDVPPCTVKGLEANYDTILPLITRLSDGVGGLDMASIAQLVQSQLDCMLCCS